MTDSPLSRRAALAAAAGAALAAAAPRTATKASPGSSVAWSPEYLECERSWQDCERVTCSYRLRKITLRQFWEDRSSARYRAAKAALLARPIASLVDVLALLRTDAWQEGYYLGAHDRRDEIATLHALERAVGATPWIVPDDIRESAAALRGQRPRIHILFDAEDV
ncbi:MAG TPA: hypothetical protein PKE16_08295 [Hyphomicrobium sp.]|nr:hypothetical protein [Hyphomicrobium sp.]